jgi:hypothetical protein
VVADDNGDDERDRGVEPVPAAGGQDDRTGSGDAGRRGGVGNGVEQDRGDGQVPAVSSVVVIVGAGPEDEDAYGHGQCGHAAHYQHRQAVHLGATGDEPLRGRSGHKQLQEEQPSAVEQRGEVRRGRPTGRSSTAGRTGRQADGEQRHRDPSGIEEIVAAFGEYRERVRHQADYHQADHKTEVQDKNKRQALGTRHVR